MVQTVCIQIKLKYKKIKTNTIVMDFFFSVQCVNCTCYYSNTKSGINMLPSPSGADLGQIWHGSGFALARADALAGARGPLQKDYMLPSPIS